MVNTGAFREIFNTANLDMLALGLPLVTFAAGGLGEYVTAPSSFSFSASDQDQDQGEDNEVRRFVRAALPVDFFPSGGSQSDATAATATATATALPFSACAGCNSVVVHWPTPRALAAALYFAALANETRARVGFAGLDTVRRGFPASKMNRAYESMFLSLISGK